MIPFVRHHRWRLGAVVVAAAGLAWLAFGFFGVHTLFTDEHVSEALPTFTPDPAAPRPAVDVPVTAPVTGQELLPTVASTEDDAGAGSAEPGIVAEYTGGFVSGAHPTSGRALVLGNGSQQRFLRFEAFETDNGPDLNVYLVNSSSSDASDVVDLGDLKGNIGEQNYEIPAGTDLDVYDRVVIWCVRFGVAFGDAVLAPV
jgi:hypothetical protein